MPLIKVRSYDMHTLWSRIMILPPEYLPAVQIIASVVMMLVVVAIWDGLSR